MYGGEDAETGKIKKIDVEDKGFEVRYALANLIAAKVIKLAEKYRARKTAEDELAAIETAVKDGVGSLSSETEKLMKECNSQKRSRYERAALKNFSSRSEKRTKKRAWKIPRRERRQTCRLQDSYRQSVQFCG